MSLALTYRFSVQDAGCDEVGSRPEVLLALRDSVPVGVAATAMGLAFGVLVSHSGLHWWWATIFASVIFAGSLEFLLLGLVVAVAPLAQIATTAFLVNFRHVFYAFSFPRHLVRNRFARLYASRHPRNPRRHRIPRECPRPPRNDPLRTHRARRHGCCPHLRRPANAAQRDSRNSGLRCLVNLL